MYSKPINFGKWTTNEIFELTVNELYNKLFSNCRLAQRERKIKTSTKTHLKVFLLNLYTCYAENPDLCIGVSLSKNTYTGSRIKFDHIIARYTPTKRVVDALKNAGYVHFKIGFNDMRTGTLRKSRICWASKLEDIFTRLNMELHTAYTQRPAIILRDSDKNEIPFTETSSTEAMKKQVEEINEIVGGLSLDFPLTAEQKNNLISRKCYPDFSRNRLTRIFNVDFDSGGRFYGH